MAAESSASNLAGKSRRALFPRAVHSCCTNPTQNGHMDMGTWGHGDMGTSQCHVLPPPPEVSKWWKRNKTQNMQTSRLCASCPLDEAARHAHSRRHSPSSGRLSNCLPQNTPRSSQQPFGRAKHAAGPLCNLPLTRTSVSTVCTKASEEAGRMMGHGWTRRRRGGLLLWTGRRRIAP
jgi:hypothetical protein